MHQRWRDLVYLHWPYPPWVVQRLLPPHVRVDVVAGAAWVGLIPFTMEGVRVRGLPPLPGRWASFVEVNVRTYVVDASGARRVWFASLDVPRLAPMVVARALYGLRYCWADASVDRDGDRVRYRSARRLPGPRGAGATIDVRRVAPIAPDDVTDLEHFLTARWGLASRWLGRPTAATLLHGRWVLHRAEVVELREDLIAAAGLPPPTGTPLCHVADAVDVTVGAPAVGGADALATAQASSDRPRTSRTPGVSG